MPLDARPLLAVCSLASRRGVPRAAATAAPPTTSPAACRTATPAAIRARTMRMKLFDRHGRVRERALTLIRCAAVERRAPDRRPDGDRLLIRFTYPNDIRGTGFLVWEHPTQTTSASSTCRRSAACAASPAPRRRRASSAATSPTRTSAGASSTIHLRVRRRDTRPGRRPAAAARPAWRLESRRKDASAQFPRVVSLVLKDSFVVVQADIYNRRNEKQKVYTVRRLEQIEGIWTAMDAEMTNALEKSRTELVDRAGGLQRRAEGADFSRRELERGAVKMSARLAGLIYRWRLPLSARFIDSRRASSSRRARTSRTSTTTSPRGSRTTTRSTRTTSGSARSSAAPARSSSR